jgi:hypothetical protein
MGWSRPSSDATLSGPYSHRRLLPDTPPVPRAGQSQRQRVDALAFPRGRSRPRSGAVSSGPCAVVEVDHAVPEAVLVQELELQADIVGKGAVATADHDRRNE